MNLIKLIDKYRSLGIDQVIDHEKFNLISIVHHSTRIEGSTLTEVETQVLINEGLTPKGKPLQDALMVTDHYNALKFTIEKARAKAPITTPLIQQINSLVIRNTGSVYNTIFGTIDARIGAFRKGKINEIMKSQKSIEDQINLSFDAHFNLVSIHPFYDGNGRTSRLLMNYIQAWYNLPFAIVLNESKAEYIQALIDTREKDDINIFRSFMRSEYEAHLNEEITKFTALNKPKKGSGFHLMF